MGRPTMRGGERVPGGEVAREGAPERDVAAEVRAGQARLGIEFGSTRIKACLIDASGRVIATGSHAWENQLDHGLWTYALADVRHGAQQALARLAEDVQRRTGARLERVAALGVSAMMHGYLAFDADGELLVPFRTWRNTHTAPAAHLLTAAFGTNVPLRWSAAHLGQAILDHEPHVPEIARLTTLAGYVHEMLTGQRVLGIGDASGMFPIEPGGSGYDREALRRFDAFAASHGAELSVESLLPEVLHAGQHAGELTPEGAHWLDPSGVLQPGAPACPPEGDAGTGMVATAAIAPRTGNVSVGTSVFAMVVLEDRPTGVHSEIDLVTTPDGADVAMIHCNNGASELGVWAALFERFAAAMGAPVDADAVFATLLREAMTVSGPREGLVTLNLLSGEPVLQLDEGRPLTVRHPRAPYTLATATRAHLDAVFAALALGMRVLRAEHIRVDRMTAHGGVFRTPGAAERVLADALATDVVVPETASEGGAWGMAILASYLVGGEGRTLPEFVGSVVERSASQRVARPDPDGVARYADYLDRFHASIDVARTAVRVVS